MNNKNINSTTNLFKFSNSNVQIFKLFKFSKMNFSEYQTSNYS